MKDYFMLLNGESMPEEDGFERDGMTWKMLGGNVSIDLKPDRRIVLRRALFSRTPFFYFSRENFFAASSSWLGLIRLLSGRGYDLRPDLAYVRDYLERQCPITRNTFCAGILNLRNGESVILDSGIMSGFAFEHPVPEETGCHEVPDIKFELERQLTGICLENSCFHLSSGLDSTALVLLASNLSQTRVRAASIQVRGEGPASELYTVRKLENDFDLDLEVFDFQDEDLFSAGRVLIAGVLGFPLAHPSHLVRFLMDREISSRGVSTIVTGQGADEVLGGYDWYHEEFADYTIHDQRLRVTPSGLVDRILDSPPLDPPDPPGGGSSSVFLSMRDRIQHDLRSVWESWSYIDSALSEYLNVVYINPFTEPDLMSSLLYLPDEYRIRGGETKWLLKRELKDIYPDYLLGMPKRGLRLDLRPYFLDFSRRDLEGELFESSSFAQLYLDRLLCDQMVRDTLEGKRNFGWQLWSLYLCGQSFELLRKSREER